MTLVAVKVGLWLGVAERFGKLVKWIAGKFKGDPPTPPADGTEVEQ